MTYDEDDDDDDDDDELELKNPKSVHCNVIVLTDCNEYLVYPRAYGITTARPFRFNSP
jgi:hypothetical protein